MRRELTVVLLCVVFTACASPMLMPQWLLDARGREAEPLQIASLHTSDGFFRTRVPAKLSSPIEAVENAYVVQLDMGATSPVECFVYTKGLDPAASLASLADATFEALESQLGDVDFKQVDEVDAGAIGGSPFLYASWLYRVNSGGELRIGEVKHMTVQKGGRTLHCLHNELGYTQSFRRVVGELVRSAKYKTPLRSRPHFTQISTLTIDGQRMGYEQTLLTRDAEGDTRIDVRSSLAIPASRGALRTSDSFGVEFADSEGRLINQVHVENENGELVTNLALDPGPDGGWVVSGTYQTKEIRAELAPGDPASWLGEAFALRRTLARQGVGSEIALVRWMPSADPVQLIEEKLSIESRVEDDRYGARLEMAGIEADLVVDGKGSVTEGSVDLGAASMGIERIYTSGRF